MSYLYEHEQLRREVEELHRLAMDAHREAQYATAERLLEQAAATAERLDGLSLLIKERSWLAEARRMQSKYAQALSTYTWLIGLATDPTQSQQVHDADSLSYLADAFMSFVDSGRFLALPVEQLLRVVADGLDWLEHIGQSNWTAGLHLQRGGLLQDQQRWQDARQELEAALALSRRYPEAPGYSLAGYLLQLAELLCQEKVGAYAESIPLAEEALAVADSNNYIHQWAYKLLAYAHLGLHEYEAALQAAQQSLALARSTESPITFSVTYEILGRIYRASGQLSEATSAAAHRWTWSRKHETVRRSYLTLQDCARVRLLQAREACILPLDNEELPGVLPASADHTLAQRRLASTRRFVHWARPFASQMDQAQGGHSSQSDLDDLDVQVDQMIRLLARQEYH